MIKRWWSEHQQECCVVMTCCYTRRPRSDRQRSLHGTPRNRACRSKTEAWICRAEAHGQQLFLLTPRGRLISDNTREGAAGQEIRRNDQVVEAAAQRRNEMRPSGVCATSASQSSALTSNVTMYLLLKYRVHLCESLAVEAFLPLGCTDCCSIHRWLSAVGAQQL